MSFRTALSGLNAASADLRTTGNNIANSGTVGFKESRAEFADVFAVSQGGVSKTAIGSGVRLSAVNQQFTQGNIDFTGKNLDMAISGDGFFILNDGGAPVYSRAGNFEVDRNGTVVNNQGHSLQVYPRQGESRDSFDLSTTQDLRLGTSEAPPRATERVETRFNLPSGAEVPDSDFAIDDPASFNHSTTVTVYDSLGQSHDATLYLQAAERGDDPEIGGRWNAYLAINGEVLPDDDGDPLAQELVFGRDGKIANGSELSFGSFDPANGADELDISFDMDEATQYGGSFSVTSLSQDGFSTGSLSGVDIDSSGVVFARFTNGQAQSLGKVALANFANPQGLQQLGDNVWGETFAAGERLRGEAGEGGLGMIQSGGLEGSNVDIAQQLVNLITAQRNFQANAQVISTADTITQTIINIR
ncbi:MAG: flagellar hook protein FlgE [Thioalkalivibrio sp.]|nr:MAG: flagellar hook protein FlgE [Thioalkalivibrio sp.]